MLTRSLILIAAISLVVVAGAALNAFLSRQADGFLPWRSAEIIQTGRVQYVAHCAGCHGMPDGSSAPEIRDGTDPGPPHDESGHSWQHPDYALLLLVRDGIATANCAPVDPERMPSFREVLSDAELVAVLSYIKSTWPDAIRQEHDRVNKLYGAYNRAISEWIDPDAAALVRREAEW